MAAVSTWGKAVAKAKAKKFKGDDIAREAKKIYRQLLKAASKTKAAPMKTMKKNKVMKK